MRTTRDAKAANGLGLGEAERLALLLEEMGEAQQIIGKILRHGYQSFHPDGGPNNRSLLEYEIGHVQAALWMMGQALDVNNYRIRKHTDEKLARVGRYLHHQSDTMEALLRTFRSETETEEKTS